MPALTNNSVTLLEFLRTKTQVDLDSLNIELAKELGPFADCTSNQADSYFEFLEPSRQNLVREAVADAHALHGKIYGTLLPESDKQDGETLTIEELSVEIAMARTSMTLIPLIQGRILVMANPTAAYSISKTVNCGRRIAAIVKHYDPSFDLDRLCIKVASTWEGLQACRILKEKHGINTLGTTLFTLEQAILAGEAGCISISPFCHELRVHFDQSYHDKDPIFGICVAAQQYYEQLGYATKVKACSVIDVNEVMQLAGVKAFTIAPHLLRELASSKGNPEQLWTTSIFNEKSLVHQKVVRRNFIDSELEWRQEYARSDKGKGRTKTMQAIALFCEYQFLAEGVIRKVAEELGL